MMKDSFAKLHPMVLITYFISQTVLTALCFHPIFLCISLVTALLFTMLILGAKPALMWLCISAANMFCFGLINPLINHQGKTVLFLLRDRPITLQAVAFGVFAGMMLSAMCLWLYIMSKTLTGKQYAFILGGRLSTLTLIAFISMRLIKRYTDKFNQIICARKGMFQNESKPKQSLSSLETLLTFALENGVETADSMTAKGYGVTKPTPYYSYSFTVKDYLASAFLILFAVTIVYGIWIGACKMYFYPAFFTEAKSLPSVLSYFFFCAFPIAVYLWSNVKWTLTK